ncbi:c6 transcription factor [Fusarium tjaetaba]|uniref:C6 transcription factor n=1 Tax=Fusarium tjaetaba TaxID=1567544 RepID=A0A8H5V930_9HYPO|nr:c6 transcription factor [Fusarium tjaetaba]KAF5612739.1 c6 transcription factor [Fusarium tjaetaba]
MEKKLKRVSRACDFCHKRARKCKLPSAEGSLSLSCLTCVEHDVACTWTRVTTKRGVKPRASRLTQNTNESCGIRPWIYDERIHGPRDTIGALIDTFFQTVYPVFPIFDQQPLLHEWHTSDLSSDRCSFSYLMGLCALSLSHIKDGAVLPSRQELFTTAAPPTGLLPVFIDNAERSIPADARGQDAFRYLPTIASLVLVAFQTRHSSLHHRYLGLFHSLIAAQNLHEEVNWPSALTEPERQRYRRIFWSMYRLEVHSALVMGHVIRCPEQQTMVAYPGDDLQHTEGNWLVGWNFVTDLYRSLEHVINHYRVKRAGRTVADAYSSRLSPREPLALEMETILSALQDGLESLPSHMMTASPLSADAEANLCGFQVANILLKTLCFACDPTTFTSACTAAQQMINSISKVPSAYLRAIGSCMFQELSGVGHLLSGFIGRPLLWTEYQELRSLLASMSTFLREMDNSTAITASLLLSQHIDRIDAHTEKMRSSYLDNSPAQDGRPYVVPSLDWLQTFPWLDSIDMDELKSLGLIP